MTVRRSLFGLALVVAGLMSPAPATRAAVPIRFTLDWKIEGPSAPFLVALDKGYFRDEGLDVTIEPGAGALKPIAQIADGRFDMGVGDINGVILQGDGRPAKGVKAVFAIDDRPAFAVIGRRSRGVTEDPKSLAGKKLGAPSADASFAKWPLYQRVAGIDGKDVDVATIGFPVREPMLAAGELDAAFGNAYSVAVNLKSRGVAADDIVVQSMAANGLKLYGSSILVNEGFARANPEAVRGFLRAYVRGLKDAIAAPQDAVKAVVARNEDAQPNVELERLRMQLKDNVLTSEVRMKGLGRIDEARMAAAIDQLELVHTFATRPRPSDIFDPSYLPSDDILKMD